jgi:hypothetical protein
MARIAGNGLSIPAWIEKEGSAVSVDPSLLFLVIAAVVCKGTKPLLSWEICLSEQVQNKRAHGPTSRVGCIASIKGRSLSIGPFVFGSMHSFEGKRSASPVHRISIVIEPTVLEQVRPSSVNLSLFLLLDCVAYLCCTHSSSDFASFIHLYSLVFISFPSRRNDIVLITSLSSQQSHKYTPFYISHSYVASPSHPRYYMMPCNACSGESVQQNDWRQSRSNACFVIDTVSI